MGGLKETLDIADFEGSDAVGFPDSREKHGLGDMLEEFEEGISNLLEVLTILSGLLKEMMKSRIHPVHEFIDSLCFKLGGHPQKRLPVRRVFDRFLSAKASSMPGDRISFDLHFEMLRIGEDLTSPLGIGGRDGITIGLKLDQTGLTDGSQDEPIGTVGDGWESHQFLFL